MAATSKVNNELTDPTASIKPAFGVSEGKSAYTQRNPCLTQKPKTYKETTMPAHFRIEGKSWGFFSLRLSINNAGKIKTA